MYKGLIRADRIMEINEFYKPKGRVNPFHFPGSTAETVPKTFFRVKLAEKKGEKDIIVGSLRGKRLYRSFLINKIKQHKQLIEELDNEQRKKMRFESTIKEAKSFADKTIDEIYDRFGRKFENHQLCNGEESNQELIEKYTALASQKLDICKNNIWNIKRQKSAVEKHIYNRRNKNKSRFIEKTLGSVISFNNKLHALPVSGAALAFIAGVADVLSPETASLILLGFAFSSVYLKVQNERTRLLESKVT